MRKKIKKLIKINKIQKNALICAVTCAVMLAPCTPAFAASLNGVPGGAPFGNAVNTPGSGLNNYQTPPSAPNSNPAMPYNGTNTQPAAPYNGYQAQPNAQPYNRYQTQPNAPYNGYQAQPNAPYNGYQAQPNAPYNGYQTQPNAPYNGYRAQPNAPYNGYQTQPNAPYNGYQAQPNAPYNGYQTPGIGGSQAAPPNYNASPSGGASLPGASIGGVQSDTENHSYDQSDYDPLTGRTRPLLKAQPVEGKIDAYHVHRGDTLWIISRKYGIKLDAVIDANADLPDPDLIYPGDVIAVPLDPSVNDNTDIGAARIDLGDGSVQIRSNVVQGRYSSLNTQQPANTANKAKANEILQLVNKERSKAGVAPLTLAADVSNVADIKAQEMNTRKYFNHTSPVYGSPFEMLRSFGVVYRTAGENIAKGQKTANAVMAAWMASPGHRANILNPKFTEMGVGYANSGGVPYWVQLFISR